MYCRPPLQAPKKPNVPRLEDFHRNLEPLDSSMWGVIYEAEERSDSFWRVSEYLAQTGAWQNAGKSWLGGGKLTANDEFLRMGESDGGNSMLLDL